MNKNTRSFKKPSAHSKSNPHPFLSHQRMRIQPMHKRLMHRPLQRLPVYLQNQLHRPHLQHLRPRRHRTKLRHRGQPLHSQPLPQRCQLHPALSHLLQLHMCQRLDRRQMSIRNQRMRISPLSKWRPMC